MRVYMKKLYEKSELNFAIMWIVIYCVVSGTIQRNFGLESPFLLLSHLLFSSVLIYFVENNQLKGKYGLSAWPTDCRRYLYFIPMWFLVTGNLWGGINNEFRGFEQICGILSMFLVGFLEELIFRGFLFKAMLKESGEKKAIIITALTFGIGHFINLFTGQTSLETIVQIPFAVAWGFIFTFVFYKCGSLFPCILAHSLIDVFSEFAVENMIMSWIYVILTIVISPVYCIYLSKLRSESSE